MVPFSRGRPLSRVPLEQSRAAVEWPGFTARTGNNDWAGPVMDACYGLMEYSYQNYRLPAWYTDADGKAVPPNDPFGTFDEFRWDGGRVRSGRNRDVWRDRTATRRCT